MDMKLTKMKLSIICTFLIVLVMCLSSVAAWGKSKSRTTRAPCRKTMEPCSYSSQCCSEMCKKNPAGGYRCIEINQNEVINHLHFLDRVGHVPFECSRLGKIKTERKRTLSQDHGALLFRLSVLQSHVQKESRWWLSMHKRLHDKIVITFFPDVPNTQAAFPLCMEIDISRHKKCKAVFSQ
ncbi:hypothetical protein Bhyg_12491 [Pseudolycoriella hygida]|uniref:Uncharacterized protein n=1 Tax=Pseudolycoriella hygida TaxID=35572 RepID=A0A9Q0MYY7_9DIPT|nr:hypothetical protein Bhyg_12491 [Pseudolycoriella hygida]